MFPNKLGRLSPRVSTRTVSDIDEFAAAMSDGLQADYVQLEAKPFRGRSTVVQLPSLTVQFVSEDVAVARRMRVPPNRWAFMIPIDVSAAARWNGHPVRSDDVIVCPARSECLAFDPPATRFAVLTVGVAMPLVAAARSLIVSDACGPVTAACGSEGHELRDRLDGVGARLESGLAAPSADWGAAVQTLLVASLVRARAGQTEMVMTDSRSRIVRRAEEFFRSHVTEGVSVAQLSTVAGVSERSLRNAFYNVYTTGPKRYMKLWQLHQVRRALRTSDVGRATVTDVATCHGFYELGRFAGAYKSFFGEAPSETLNKARNREVTTGAA